MGTDHGQRPSNASPTSSAYDVFISYANADRAWVDGFLIDGLERLLLVVDQFEEVFADVKPSGPTAIAIVYAGENALWIFEEIVRIELLLQVFQLQQIHAVVKRSEPRNALLAGWASGRNVENRRSAPFCAVQGMRPNCA